jgi:hypothetical protein
MSWGGGGANGARGRCFRWGRAEVMMYWETDRAGRSGGIESRRSSRRTWEAEVSRQAGMDAACS